MPVGARRSRPSMRPQCARAAPTRAALTRRAVLASRAVMV
jgi:hypothetical protein